MKLLIPVPIHPGVPIDLFTVERHQGKLSKNDTGKMQCVGRFNLVKGEGVIQSSCNYTHMSTNVLACHSKIGI